MESTAWHCIGGGSWAASICILGRSKLSFHSDVKTNNSLRWMGEMDGAQAFLIWTVPNFGPKFPCPKLMGKQRVLRSWSIIDFSRLTEKSDSELLARCYWKHCGARPPIVGQWKGIK
ncbi:hypothetical protein CUMW_282270 [Citrus unshiu]|uniref:Uncharacterized protein n=1 Tax=Citrus unshiu TaxID=55188 RepID=A0A2H5N0W1_CITUN|nr:hypothetical protein CUMW_282270 [Citrus unshiu]